MMFFRNFSKNDRATFEGRDVSNILPVIDRKSKEVTHYQCSVAQDDGNIELRKFRVDEIPHLIENEVLVIDHGYYSPARQQDRALYGKQELTGATAAQRERVDLVMYRNRLMDRYRAMGMKLTRKGVDEFRNLMAADYENYQARKYYGTKKANASQKLKRLPCADTLLNTHRKYRKTAGNPNAFLAPLAAPIDDDLQASADFCFVMERLGAYACATKPSKKKIIEDLFNDIEEINTYRKSMGHSVLIRRYSQRTYERWIDRYLDPFEVCMQRDGLEKAQKKFGSFDPGREAEALGEIVITDAWQFHVVVLDTTREEWNRMTEEERSKVKLVRPWTTVAEDAASRAIVGCSFSKTPCEAASLETLRMMFMDKTYLFRDIGIKDSSWGFAVPVQEIVNDNGGEFGKQPFGGALFSMGARLLSSSQMNSPAGVSHLRGAMERFFWTSDQKWARYLPGYTAQNPQARNDRKFLSEACITLDELQTLYIAFIAEYHKTPHRGLNFRTPAAVWEELSQSAEFDMTQMPSPGQLREACGFYSKAKVGEAGIRFAGAVYSNEFIRNQRKARKVDQIAAPGETLEIKVDPYDLGGISVVADGELISVRCLDPKMAGKSLREWEMEKRLQKEQAKAEELSQKGARDEAANLWRNLAKSVMRTADIGFFGYTKAEVARAARELDFGKGHHEKPFIGRDEYRDPIVEGGFDTGTAEGAFDEEDLNGDLRADARTSMDRFRSTARNRKRRAAEGEEK